MTMMGWLGVHEPLFDEWGNSQILRRPQDDKDVVYALAFLSGTISPWECHHLFANDPKKSMSSYVCNEYPKIDCHPEASEGSGCSFHFLTTISSFIKNA
jgi:hypothetical protein